MGRELVEYSMRERERTLVEGGARALATRERVEESRR